MRFRTAWFIRAIGHDEFGRAFRHRGNSPKAGRWSIDGKQDFTYCLVSRGTRAMDFLLGFNDDAALVGDLEGQVRTETRPAQSSSKDWEVRLRNKYLEPEHGYNEEGMPFQNMTGDFRFENGQVKVVRLEGVKPYETFSDEASGLSVRAVFLSHLNQWAVAD